MKLRKIFTIAPAVAALTGCGGAAHNELSFGQMMLLGFGVLVLLAIIGSLAEDADARTETVEIKIKYRHAAKVQPTRTPVEIVEIAREMLGEPRRRNSKRIVTYDAGDPILLPPPRRRYGIAYDDEDSCQD